MCFTYFRPPTGCIYYGPCQPTTRRPNDPMGNDPMLMEDEFYIEGEMGRYPDEDEMENYEMDPYDNMEYQEGMENREPRRFRARHPYRYTCPQRVRRCY